MNDRYGLYPVEIAKTIKDSGKAESNLLVNLLPDAKLKHDLIRYLDNSISSYTNYLNSIDNVQKIILHSYTEETYAFLKLAVKKFPGAKVYWLMWSFELYNLPHLIHSLYDPFSARFINLKRILQKRFLKQIIIRVKAMLGLRKNYMDTLTHWHSLVHYGLSPLYHDFLFMKNLTKNNIEYREFAYFSLDKMLQVQVALPKLPGC